MYVPGTLLRTRLWGLVWLHSTYTHGYSSSDDVSACVHHNDIALVLTTIMIGHDDVSICVSFVMVNGKLGWVADDLMEQIS